MITDLRNRCCDPSSVDSVPSWVRLLFGEPADAELTPDGRSEVTVVSRDDWSLCSVRAPDAGALNADAFRRVTASAYRTLNEAIRGQAGLQPVCIWNFIPGILDPIGEYTHRYMAFNEGRFDAFREWYGDDESFSGGFPASSGVGNPSPDLVIHVLACGFPRVPVENPRQVSAYSYSARYGPRPPCFSRAMRVERDGLNSSVLLLGGTASVVGENTVHPGNVNAQLDETLRNLTALVHRGLWPRADRPAATDALERVIQLRVYYVNPEDLAAIDQAVTTRFTRLRELEYVQTTLCRDDLLVEMEGVAALSGWSPFSRDVG